MTRSETIKTFFSEKRAALRPPSDVPLDRTEQQLLRRRDYAVRTKLYYRRRDRWIHPDLAADRGDMV